MKLPSRIKACFLLLLTACPVASIAAPLDTVSSPSLAAATAPAVEPKVDTAALVALFDSADFAALDGALEKLRADYDPATPYDYRELELAIDGLNVYFPPRQHTFLRWIESAPESYFAHLLYASYLVSHAWDARGSGVASTVTERGWELYGERLELARSEFERAIQLDPRLPFPYTGLVTTAMGLSLGDEDVLEHFTACRAADPSYARIHDAVMYYLTPRWHGSLSKMFNFARRWGPEAPAHSLIPAIIFTAHKEAAFIQGEQWWQRPEVWEEVHPILDRLGREFPDRTFIHHYHARLAAACGRWDVARPEFDKIGDDYVENIWLSREHFNQMRDLARSTGNQAPAAAAPRARGIATVEDFIGLVNRASRGNDALAVVGMADTGLTKFDLSNNPTAEASLRYYKASALRKLGRIPEALAECELGLARNPDELYTLYLASSVMLRQPTPQTDFAKALDYARRAVAIAGRREPAYLENLVAALIANDMLEEASAVNKELLALVATDPRAQYRQRFLDKQEKPDINATPAEIKQALGLQ